MWRFVRSPFGLTLLGIRDSESRMRSLGYNVPLHLFIGFTVSGFFAGIAGALYAMFNNFVSPSTVALAQSVEGVLMMIAGGVGTLFGGFRRGGCDHRAGKCRQRLHRALADGARRYLHPHHDLRPRGHHRHAARHPDAQGTLISLPRKDIENGPQAVLEDHDRHLRRRWRNQRSLATRVRAGRPDQDRPAGSAHRRCGLGRQGDGRGRAVLPRSDQKARSPAARWSS